MGWHTDTRAVITGGAQGLGRAIAERMIADGCRALVISGRDIAKGETAAGQLARSGAAVHFVAADMARVDDCRNLIDRAADRVGPVNALVNAAAACDRGSLLDTTPEVWAHLLDTNTRGPFFTMQAVVGRARAEGFPASILNVLSMAMYCGQSFLAPYAASKAALATLTRNVAQAHRNDRIRCNAICPGWMDTPGEDATQRKFHDAADDWLTQAEAAQPFGQLIKPDELAPLASYLLSPQSGVMTGAIIDYDQNVVGAYPEVSAPTHAAPTEDAGRQRT